MVRSIINNSIYKVIIMLSYYTIILEKRRWKNTSVIILYNTFSKKFYIISKDKDIHILINYFNMSTNIKNKYYFNIMLYY